MIRVSIEPDLVLSEYELPQLCLIESLDEIVKGFGETFACFKLVVQIGKPVLRVSAELSDV